MFFFNDTATTEIYTLSLHDALPIYVTGYYKLGGHTTVNNSSNIALIAIEIFIDATIEEFIHRGIILENLRKYGDMFAIIVSGIIFGTIHGTVIFCKSLTGVLLGIIYVVSGNIKWSRSEERRVGKECR